MVKICPKCGKDNAKDSFMCSKCGALLGNAEVVDAATVKKVATTDATNKAATMQTTNSAISILIAIAIIIYSVAFIMGIKLGNDWEGFFTFEEASKYWFAGFIFGSMFLAFAEIVRLLDEINKKA